MRLVVTSVKLSVTYARDICTDVAPDAAQSKLGRACFAIGSHSTPLGSHFSVQVLLKYSIRAPSHANASQKAHMACCTAAAQSLLMPTAFKNRMEYIASNASL
jgi:hypothetical protein